VKALVLEEYGRLVYRGEPDPVPGPDEVLIEVKACGICGSDIHGYDGSSGRRVPPLIMGHEASGVVAAVGDRVEGWGAGDRVTFDSTVWCGDCFHCARGEVNLCDRRQVLGVSTGEYRRHGAFAEYVVVPRHILHRIPDEVTFVQAAAVEPLAVAVHALDRTLQQGNESALVVGAGMVGLLAIQALRAAGNPLTIAIDLDPDRLELAGRLGADATLAADDPSLASRIRELTHGRGADRSFEVVGTAAAVRTAISNTRKGGSVTLIGNLQPSVPLPLQDVVTRQISLLGSCALSGEYPACLDLISAGDVDLDPLISAAAPLAEGAVWFDRLYKGGSGLLKVVLQP
jgi:L-iditol 2-dehydrogenase